MKRPSDCVLVSISCQGDEENAVLIVGRKAKRKDVEIVNAFQGQEAIELYEKLITKKEKKDGDEV